MRIDLTEVNQDLSNTVGEELRKVSNNFERLIKNEENNYTELNNIRNVLEELTNKLIKVNVMNY